MGTSARSEASVNAGNRLSERSGAHFLSGAPSPASRLKKSTYCIWLELSGEVAPEDDSEMNNIMMINELCASRFSSNTTESEMFAVRYEALPQRVQNHPRSQWTVR